MLSFRIWRAPALRIAVGFLMVALYLTWGASTATTTVNARGDVWAENIPLQVTSYSDVNITKVGHFGGVTYAAEPSGNYAYIGQGGDFVVLDISNKIDPIEVGRVETKSIIKDITLAGNYAYIAGYNGLVIVDVTNPEAPTLKGRYDNAMASYGVDVVGNYAYLADWDNGLVIVDVNNPAAPTLKGSFDTAGVSLGVAVAGNYAYVADGANGLLIVDVTNPEVPTLKGRYNDYGYYYSDSRGVEVGGNYAYVANAGNSGLVIIDVSNPVAPTLKGRYIGGSFLGVAIAGNYAYVAGGYDGEYGLVIVDVSNPAVPSLRGSINTAGSYEWPYGVAVAGNYAYVAGSNGLVLVDVANPSAPSLKGRYDTYEDLLGVAITGNYAYVAGGYDGLVIVDVTNPSASSLKGSYNTSGPSDGVAVMENYAYVAGGFAGLVILDVSNPSAPSLKGSYDTAGMSYRVTVAGDYVYVADWYNGLVIIDVSNPSVPTLKSSYDTAGISRGVAIAGNYAYVADGENGLVILDVSNPSAPTLKGSYDTAGNSMGVGIAGNYAYVADGENGLMIVDVSNPSAPTFKSSLDTNGNSWGVAMAGDYAYVVGSNGLVIVNVSNPASPTLKGSYDTAGNSMGVGIAGNYAYVADGENGLEIFHISGATSPSDLSILINDGKGYSNSTFVNLSLTANSADNMSFKNNGLSWSDWETFNTSKSWTLSSGDGSKTVYFKTRNSAGESAPVNDTIILDTTIPLVNLTSPVNGSFVKIPNIDFRGNASDNYGLTTECIETISYPNTTGGGGTSAGSITCGGWSNARTYIDFSHNLTLPEGSYMIRITYFDVADNPSTSSVNVTLDTVKPAVTNISIGHTTPEINELVNIIADVSDKYLDNTNIFVSVKNPDGLINKLKMLPSGNGKYYVVYNNITKKGRYNVTILAGDMAGNINDTGKTWFVANLPPYVNISVNTSANNVTEINAMDEVNTTLEIFTLNNTSNGNINISMSEDIPPEMNQTFALTPLGKYIEINACDDLKANLSSGWLTIKIYYSISELKGLNENSLRIFWYNDTTIPHRWETLSKGSPSWVHDIGVATADIKGFAGYVWANISHLSTFGLVGSYPSEDGSTTPGGGGPSGGGGGGGGGASGENFTNIEAIEKYDMQISKDVVTTYRFTHALNPIMFVEITGNTSLGIITASIEVLKHTSTLVSFPPDGLVYKNANIWVGTAGFATPKNIKDAVIRFRVENSWLLANGFTGKDVKMFRWTKTDWIQLETIEKTKDDTYTYFDARTNIFSPFAIAGIKGQEMVVQPTIQQPQTRSPAVTAASTERPQSSIITGIGILAGFLGFALPQGEESGAGTYLVFAFVGIIIIVLLARFVKRRL